MPSLLLYLANDINQYLNKYNCLKCPIGWSTTEKEWTYGKKYKWRTYLISSFLLNALGFIPLMTFALYRMVYGNPELLNLQRILVTLILLQADLAIIFFDLVSFVFGKEVAACANWCNNTDDCMLISDLKGFLAKSGSLKHKFQLRRCSNTLQNCKNLKTLFDFVKNILANFADTSDTFGLLMIIFVISINVLAPVLYVVLIIAKLDPFQIYLSFLADTLPETLWIFKITLLVGIPILGHWILTAFKSFILLIFGIAVMVVKIEKRLALQTVNIIVIKIYKQSLVVQSILFRFEKFFLTLGLNIVFFIMVSTLSIAIVSIEVQKLNLFILTFFTFSVVATLTLYGFHICCSIHEISLKMKKTWISQKAEKIIVVGF